MSGGTENASTPGGEGLGTHNCEYCSCDLPQLPPLYNRLRVEVYGVRTVALIKRKSGCVKPYSSGSKAGSYVRSISPSIRKGRGQHRVSGDTTAV